jgi:hypothetical protein
MALSAAHSPYKSGPFDAKELEALLILRSLHRRFGIFEIYSRVTRHVDKEILISVLVVSDRLDKVHVHLPLSLGSLYL